MKIKKEKKKKNSQTHKNKQGQYETNKPKDRQHMLHTKKPIKSAQAILKKTITRPVKHFEKQSQGK